VKSKRNLRPRTPKRLESIVRLIYLHVAHWPESYANVKPPEGMFRLELHARRRRCCHSPILLSTHGGKRRLIFRSDLRVVIIPHSRSRSWLRHKVNSCIIESPIAEIRFHQYPRLIVTITHACRWRAASDNRVHLFVEADL